MDDPRDKLLNSNNNLGINGKREKGIKFLSIISFSFFFFFYLQCSNEGTSLRVTRILAKS